MRRTPDDNRAAALAKIARRRSWTSRASQRESTSASEVGSCSIHAHFGSGRIGTVDEDRQADLQEALSLDDTNRILELTSKLSEGAERLVEMRGGMSP